MGKWYAGVGSRRTPSLVLVQMTAAAAVLEQSGFKLRSGGAVGADSAFQYGVQSPNNKEVLRPVDASEEASLIAEKYHPAWHNCTSYAKKLHARNVQIVLGRSLNEPVDFLVCWTPEPVSGGTRMGIVVAKDRGIPVYNLSREDDHASFVKFLDGIK